MNRRIIKTSDNSDTIFDEELQEIFHSKHGALNESNHVFIKNGLNYLSNKYNEFSIFEIGFGTGLNTILTLIESESQNKHIKYYSIEAYPLDKDIWEKLNYNEFLSKKYQEIFYNLHNIEWNKEFNINDNFTLKKINQYLENYNPEIKFDLIYFDAFSPEKQPQLWTYEIFNRLYENLNNNGILVTYSAKGEVKRNLQKCGFIIEKLEGPIGKREMIRARKEI